MKNSTVSYLKADERSDQVLKNVYVLKSWMLKDCGKISKAGILEVENWLKNVVESV
jgi:hypothetical protein